jgi:ABC-type glycerol-3-phosphate transport system substrate-binding protein
MSKNKLFSLFTLILLLSMVMAACATPTPEVIEKTVEVKVIETQEVIKEVEVTKEVMVEVEVTPVPEDMGPVELVIWGEGITAGQLDLDPAADPRAEYAHMLVEKFMEENPDIIVKFENHGWDEELRQNLTNAVLAGTGPCVIVGEGFFKNYAALGAMLPLNDALGDVIENAVPGTYQGAQLNNDIYGLASFTSVFGFERNCDVIEAAGLDCSTPPATWNELLAQAEQITEAGQGAYYGYTLQGPAGFSMGAPFRIYVYLLEAGADMARPDVETGLDFPYFNDPNAVQVYEFLREIAKTTPPGLLFDADEGRVYTQLFQGVSAYQMAGGWHVQWAKDSGCTNCQYSTVPLPEGGQPATVVVANVIYGIMNTCKYPEAAAEWIRFTQRDDVQALVFQANGRIPTTYTALEALRPTVDPATQAYIDTLVTSTNVNAMPQWVKNPQKVWQVYNDFLTRLFTTEEPIQALMDEAQLLAEEAVK